MVMRRFGVGSCGVIALFVVACSGSDPVSPGAGDDGGGGAAQDAGATHDGASHGGNDAAIPNGDSGGGDDDASASADGATTPDAGPNYGPYPSGPYGITAGDVIQNFTW